MHEKQVLELGFEGGRMLAGGAEGTERSAQTDGAAEQRPAGVQLSPVWCPRTARGLAVCPYAKDFNQALKVTVKRIQTGEGWDYCLFQQISFLILYCETITDLQEG